LSLSANWNITRFFKLYFNQLMMLSRLRKIEELTIKITEEMPIHIDIETDTLYLRGKEQGLEQGLEQVEQKTFLFVRNLLLITDHSDETIALLADVTLEFVEKVKLALESEDVEKKDNP
jgi:hypothetical protein